MRRAARRLHGGTLWQAWRQWEQILVQARLAEQRLAVREMLEERQRQVSALRIRSAGILAEAAEGVAEVLEAQVWMDPQPPQPQHSLLSLVCLCARGVWPSVVLLAVWIRDGGAWRSRARPVRLRSAPGLCVDV